MMNMYHPKVKTSWYLRLDLVGSKTLTLPKEHESPPDAKEPCGTISQRTRARLPLQENQDTIFEEMEQRLSEIEGGTAALVDY